MSLERTPEIVRILEAQEMKGERIVNHIRLGFALLGFLILPTAWEVNTPLTNRIFAAQLGAWLLYALVLYAFFYLRPEAYVGWLKYLSIFIDLALVTLAAAGNANNHSGIIEYMTSYTPLIYVLWNLMSAFRYSMTACLYSAGLSILFNSIVLIAAVTSGAIAISERSVYGQNAINIADQVQQIIFIALPGIVAGIIARISRGLVLRAEVESMQRGRLEHEKQELGRYLSKDLVDFVLSEPSRLKLGGSRRHVAVMFTDIRNFTPLTEAIEPEVVVSFLNDYFSDMVDIVFRYGGALDKYTGDGLMAVFGAPLPVNDASGRAVMAAVEMMTALARFNERQEGSPFGSIEMGVGIATGTVVSGNIGSLQRMEYTSVGDTVNTAARLEQMNKDLGSQIVICQSTFEALGNSVPAYTTGTHMIRGKHREVRPYIVAHDRISPARIEELRRRILATPPRLDSLPPRSAMADSTPAVASQRAPITRKSIQS